MRSRSDYSDNLSSLQRWLIAYGALAPFSDEFSPIVANIRKQRGIVPPLDQEAFKHNLKAHPLSEVEADVMRALTEIKLKPGDPLASYLALPKRIRLASKLIPPFVKPLAWLPEVMRLVADYLEKDSLESVFSMLAKPLARYIAFGPMELPEPLAIDFLGSTIAIPVAGDCLVVALAHRGSKPRDLADRFVAQWYDTFEEGQRPVRDRVPESLARDAWVWATYEGLDTHYAFDLTEEQRAASRRLSQALHQSVRDISRYCIVAELYREAFPEDQQHDPAETDEAYLQRMVPLLRQARARFQARFAQEARRWPQLRRERSPYK